MHNNAKHAIILLKKCLEFEKYSVYFISILVQNIQDPPYLSCTFQKK